MLAWGADRAAAGGLQATGALGPVDAFGLIALTDGCRWAGLEPDHRGCRVTGPHAAGLEC